MAVAVTGHRPNRLGGYSPSVRLLIENFAASYVKEQIGPESSTKLLVGMALGWDQAVAKAAILYRVPFIAVVPYRGYENGWLVEDIIRYRKLLQQAEDVRIISKGGYAGWKLQRRNEWMVDNCHEVVALWDGHADGGTFNCIQYANANLVMVKNLWPDYIKLLHALPISKPKPPKKVLQSKMPKIDDDIPF